MGYSDSLCTTAVAPAVVDEAYHCIPQATCRIRIASVPHFHLWGAPDESSVSVLLPNIRTEYGQRTGAGPMDLVALTILTWVCLMNVVLVINIPLAVECSH